MAIRCTSKAIVLQDGEILLNRCLHPDGGVYYDLPGGGQRPGETMEDALVREVREETGYTVQKIRFAGLAEEMYTAPLVLEAYPEYAHRVLHLFTAELSALERGIPCEKDLYMDECVWMPLEEAEKQRVNPEGIAAELRNIAQNGKVVYLGTRQIAELA